MYVTVQRFLDEKGVRLRPVYSVRYEVGRDVLGKQPYQGYVCGCPAVVLRGQV